MDIYLQTCAPHVHTHTWTCSHEHAHMWTCIHVNMDTRTCVVDAMLVSRCLTKTPVRCLFVTSCDACVWSDCRNVFAVDDEEHTRSMKTMKEGILEGTANWSARLVITGERVNYKSVLSLVTRTMPWSVIGSMSMLWSAIGYHV